MSEEKKKEEAAPAVDLAAEQAQREQARLNKKLSKYSLLVAEDNLDLQAALVQAAEERGFNVVTAADGIEAVRRAMAQSFDAIVFDMNLPRKMGNEAIAEIRHAGLSKRSVIVVLSGYLKKEVVQTLVGKIEKAFTKPADIDLVLDTVVSFIENKSTEKAG